MPIDDPDNPAHLCGSVDPSPGDTAYFLYSYPFLLNTKLGGIRNRALFGTRHAIVLRAEEYEPRVGEGPYTNTETTSTDVTVRLIRLGD